MNELLGHRAGDQLLRTVAERLRVCVRESDTLARAGGDEFVIILSVVSDEDGISSAASKILAIISEPFVIEERELYLTASIGVAVYPTDGADVQSLLKHADLAMYQAKDMDRNNFQFFSSDLNVKVMERMVLESSLRRALERDEFKLLYQPQVDVISGSVVGFEALLRWHHPDLGTISPEKFIPLAEETGLILSIGEWVLRNACRQAKAWQDAGLKPVRMAVNLSGRQFRMKLDQVVAAILLETGFDPHWLELELTESILMRNASENIELLQALTAMGCSLSIDDFGTGYSSLSHLKHFPIDRLKIDRSFVGMSPPTLMIWRLPRSSSTWPIPSRWRLLPRGLRSVSSWSCCNATVVARCRGFSLAGRCPLKRRKSFYVKGFPSEPCTTTRSL